METYLLRILPVGLNIAGLVLDCIGVLGLFFMVTKDFKKISDPSRLAEIRAKSMGGQPDKEDLRQLVKDLNQEFATINADKAASNKRSQNWILVIIWGFIFQLLSSLAQLLISL